MNKKTLTKTKIEKDMVTKQEILLSEPKPNNIEKYIIWHIQGGLGKNIAATALIPDLKKKYSDRKLIMVVSYPTIFLNNPNIDRVYQIGQTPHFYETYIENKDTLIFKHEPYDTTGHITKKSHLIESWCELLNLEYKSQQPEINTNYAQSTLPLQWIREKPILLLQTTGGAQNLALDPSNPNLAMVPKNPYHWTRDIPYEVAKYIVSLYSSEYHIIQITRNDGYYLENVERMERPLTNIELLSLVSASKKRIFIDSSLQHMAAAIKLSSTVFWIGTSPKVFGYELHNNIVAKLPKKANQLVNSYTFDYQFEQNLEECPYLKIEDMFDIDEVSKQLGK